MFEIKRNLNLKNIMMFLILGLAIVVLGFALLVTIDGYSLAELSQNLVVESVYTVVTQFGPLVFSAITIYFISNDYKEKTIYFYQKLNYNPVKYYIAKISSLFILFALTLFLATSILALYFKNFSGFFIVFFKMFTVIMVEVMVACFFAFLFDNFVKAFFTNFLVWIIGIVISAKGGIFEYFAYYDAANRDYGQFIHYLKGMVPSIGQQFLSAISYNLLIFLTCTVLVALARKRWVKNGI